MFLTTRLQPVHDLVLKKIIEWQFVQQQAVVGLVQEPNIDDIQAL